MKAPKPLRLSVLVLAVWGAGMFWFPFLLERLGHKGAVSDIMFVFGPWWFMAAFACLVVAVPLSVLSLLRRDYIGAFGLIAALSAGIWVWNWLWY